MKVLKKTCSLFIILALAVSIITACSPEKPREPGKYKIAVVPKTISISWFQRMESGIAEFNAENGTDYYYGGPTNIEDQTAYVEQLLAEDWDVICIDPFDADSITPLLERAKKEEILVITHEAASMDSKYYDYDLESFESSELGEHFGKMIIEQTGGKGTYVQLVGSLNSITHREWCDSAEAYIKEHSDMINLGRYETSDNMTNAYNKTKELLQAHPEITAVECSASTDVPGVARAVEELGLAGKVAIAGISQGLLCSEYINNGTLKSIAFFDSGKAGAAMLALAEKILSEGDAFDPKHVSLPVEGYENMILKGRVFYGNGLIEITKENLELYNF